MCAIHSPLSHSPKHPQLLWPAYPATALSRDTRLKLELRKATHMSWESRPKAQNVEQTASEQLCSAVHPYEGGNWNFIILVGSINTWADIGNVKGSWDEIAKENDTSAEQVKEKPFVIDLDLRGYFWGQGWAGTLCWWGSMWCFHRNWRCQCRWPGFGQKMVKNTDEQSWFAKSHLIYWEDTAGNSSKNVTNKFKSSIEASLCCKRYTWYCLKDLLRIESLYAMTMPTMLTWMKTKRSSSMILRAKKRETKKELHIETSACSALKMMSPMK